MTFASIPPAGVAGDHPSAHDDVSVTEQPAFPWALCEGSRGSLLAGGSCACKDGSAAKRQSGKEIREIVRPVMRWLSFPGISMRCFCVPIAAHYTEGT